ncbi:MAG TPA: DUF3368 domain-containing protein [Bacteroidales bacterium]|nr:DUF3368 domain-containing protein [Bacteroidales bacterium]
MRKVVANTTPILSLIKINKLDLLEQLYGKIFIPKAVYIEIQQGKQKPHYEDLKNKSWIEIKTLKKPEKFEFVLNLDKGEAEAILLAKEINADLIIMDEIAGRRVARNIDSALTGTLGVLLKAKEKGFIGSVGSLLRELKEEGIWISSKLEQKVLHLAKEK